MLTGSVDRPNPTGESSQRFSGALGAKFRSLWSSHRKSYLSGSRNANSNSVEDDGSHVFVRLPDNGRTEYFHTDIGVSDMVMKDMKKNNEIQVRTDLRIDDHV